jgi:uncharacterized protein RhaS with RHS repeats
VRLEYDAAGNLLFDGQHAYQYDAWNRLIQVNRATSDGHDPQTLTIGPLVKHYTYDAVGRLIRTQSPFPDPDTSTGEMRSERFYYDGIRRVQEWLIGGVVSLDGAEGDPELSALAAATVGSSIHDLDGETLNSWVLCFG